LTLSLLDKNIGGHGGAVNSWQSGWAEAESVRHSGWVRQSGWVRHRQMGQAQRMGQAQAEGSGTAAGSESGTADGTTRMRGTVPIYVLRLKNYSEP